MSDALSAILEMLDVRTAASTRFEAAGRWGLNFPEPGQLGIVAVLAGHCRLTPAGTEAIPLEAGDCVLLAGDRPFTLASGPDEEALPRSSVLPEPRPPVVYYQTTADATEVDRTVLVSGRVTLDCYAAGLLLDDLPPAVRIAASSSPQRLAPILEMLSAEAARPDSLGSTTVRQQLTQVLAVYILRAVLADRSASRPPGWLNALVDPQIGAALAAIHDLPQRRWTVAELAHAATMSRSAFAARFRDLVGAPPLAYLTEWRIQQAAHALRTTDKAVAQIGAAAGYPVETTFNSTFKRVTGKSPGRYRRDFHAAAGSGEREDDRRPKVSA